ARTISPASEQQSPIRLRRFSYRELRSATGRFSDSHKLGQGGFGSVFKGTLKNGQHIAVKKLDTASLQGEREFMNELSIMGSMASSPFVVGLIGFCAETKRKMLVYEFMANRSLQEVLFDEKHSVVLQWERRAKIVADVARALAFLHGKCEPPIVHGDVKPSNVLLGADFGAKLADFGLARVKTQESAAVDERERNDDFGKLSRGGAATPSSIGGGQDDDEEWSKLSQSAYGTEADTWSKISPSEIDCRSEISFDGTGQGQAGIKNFLGRKKPWGQRKASASPSSGNGKNSNNGSRDWWWKQESSGQQGGGGGEFSIREYIVDWVSCENRRGRSRTREWPWNAASSGTAGAAAAGTSSEGKNNVKKKKKQARSGSLEWWAECDDDDELAKRIKAEQKRKKKLRKEQEKLAMSVSRESSRDCNETNNNNRKGGRLFETWSRESLSGELTRRRRRERSRSHSRDWWSGDLVSRVSSTPSMRGTVCYVAPEYGGGGVLTEKSDVYSFGVLLLVVVSGRRPLQVVAAPLSEFERANLISWARHAAQAGRGLDLVDPLLAGAYSKEQATLFISLALLCLQRVPSLRPSMSDVVKIFSGEAELPALPFEFSPSPPGCGFKSRRK
ncbi:hypothetical protein SELMODRAFT_41504, partial [Selaginella moellendorffii]